jgi:dTDP-glucose pyrophosphorylase
MSKFVFLCGGKGERFRDTTPYKKPLPLIYGRHIFQWCVDSFKHQGGDLIVSHNDDFHGGCIYRKIKNEYESCFNICSAIVPYQTRGPCETVYISCKDHFSLCAHESFWVLDNDNIYDNTIDWSVLNTDASDVYVVVKKMEMKGLLGAPSPFGHVVLDSNGNVTSVVEKVNVSNNILVGAYGFKSWHTFVKLFGIMFEDGKERKELFMSDLVNVAVDNGFKVGVCYGTESYAIGTPQQVEETLSQGVITPQKLRWVFDLDETLVTRPEVVGDYLTCKPIANMVEFVNKLYDQGHHIIIHTARHMLTCDGDVNMVKHRIGQKTRDSLYMMGIQHHELIFGKPYGDIYVDDKACNTYAMHDADWCKSALGFGWNFTPPKDHHKIERIANDTCTKTGTPSELLGYHYYLDNCGIDLSPYIPKVFKVCYDGNNNIEKLILEWKDGIVIGKMYAYGTMSERILDEVLKLQKTIHSYIGDKPCEALVLENYLPKLKQRLEEHKAAYENLYELDFDQYIKFLEMFFSEYNPQICARIHGDFWLSNLLWHHETRNIFTIDMRGRLGETLHIGGDAVYDYAKLYQSMIGFDHVLMGRYDDFDLDGPLQQCYSAYLKANGIDEYDVKVVTFTLLLGSFPFHKELMVHKTDYVAMIRKLWDEILIGRP